MDGLLDTCTRCQTGLTINDNLIGRDICESCTQVLYAQQPYITAYMMKDLKKYGIEKD